MVVPWIFISAVACYLVVARPALNFRYYRKWENRIKQSESSLRIKYYRSMTLRSLVPAVFAYLSLLPFHVAVSQAGFELPRIRDWTTILITERWVTVMYETLAVAFFIFAIALWLQPLFKRPADSSAGGTESREQETPVTSPITTKERTAWVLTSIVTSVAGQFTYTAFLVLYFKMLLPGVWIGLIIGIVAVIHGLLRMYAGRKYISLFATWGLIYSTMYVVTHSLLLPALLAFLMTGFLAIHHPVVQKTGAGKLNPRLRVFGVLVISLVISLGLNTVIRNQPVNARTLLQNQATYWSSLNQKQRIQVVRESLKENHYHGSLTTQDVVNKTDNFYALLQAAPIGMGDAINSIQTINVLIQTSIIVKTPPK